MNRKKRKLRYIRAKNTSRQVLGKEFDEKSIITILSLFPNGINLKKFLQLGYSIGATASGRLVSAYG